jgi:hypothetical protein
MKKPGLFLAVCLLHLTMMGQYVPNGGFESWTSMGSYNNPDQWFTFNDYTADFGIYTCAKGTPGSPGAAYMKLTSKSIAGVGVIPAIATTGTLDFTTQAISGGFPLSVKPTSLSGNWQYMGGSAADVGFIHVLLTRWNTVTLSRDTVGSGHVDLVDMVMSWANFNVPIAYNSNAIPDTCQIVLSASGPNPAANSYLYVDNLSLDVPIDVEEMNDLRLRVFPNPFENSIVLDASDGEFSGFRLTDATGKQVLQQEVLPTRRLELDWSSVASGCYVLQVWSKNKEFRTVLTKP